MMSTWGLSNFLEEKWMEILETSISPGKTMETKVQEYSNLIYKEKAIVPYTYWPMEKPIIEEIDD